MKRKYFPAIISVLLLLCLIPGLGVFAEGALVSSGTRELQPGGTFDYQINLATLSADFRANPFTIQISGDQINGVSVGGTAAAFDGAANAFTVSSAAISGDTVAVKVTFAAEATAEHSVTTTVINENAETYSGSLTVTIQSATEPPTEKEEGVTDDITPGTEIPVIVGGYGDFGGYPSGGSSSASDATVYRGSANNYLKALSVKGTTIDPGFHKTNDTYFIDLNADTTTVTVNATAEEAKAITVITGNTDLKPGLNKILIGVTAENGDVRYYRIYATREDK